MVIIPLDPVTHWVIMFKFNGADKINESPNYTGYLYINASSTLTNISPSPATKKIKTIILYVLTVEY